MKNNYKVYVHISPNGKRYYGITSQKVEYHWGKNGKGYKTERFTKAINKYGWDNFEHIVIARGLTKDEAEWIKIELIREWDTTNPEYGYNVGYKSKIVSKEARKKMSESSKGKTMSEEAKKKMSEAREGTTHTEEVRKKMSEDREGHEVTEETREKISKSNKGKCHKPTRVYCVELDMYFETVTEAGKYIGRAYGNISSVLTGRNKTCGGYHWMYAKDVENKGVS